MTDRDENRILITAYRGQKVCARYAGFKMTDITVCSTDDVLHVGDIVIGKVSTVRPQIHAAFVSLGSGPDAYLNLDDPHDVIYTKGDPGRELTPGDEILVQVIREAHADKAMSVSTNLMFTGRNVILMTGKRMLGISTKIPEGRKKELRHYLSSFLPDGFGVIVRTAADRASMIEITEELSDLSSSASEKICTWKMRTFGSVVERGPGDEADFILQHVNGKIDEILTDLPEEYERMRTFLKEEESLGSVRLRLYESENMPLSKVYSLETQIEKALSKRVWLKSGACLYIEQTEAMAVIDVNSGKALTEGKRHGGHSKREAVNRINEEAASQIARQIRLRNLSGIIVVDFIDMNRDEEREKILEILRRETADDPAGVHVVDMTPLSLCEMTRKRRKKPLCEQISLDL